MDYSKSGSTKGGMADGSMIRQHKQMAMGKNPMTSRNNSGGTKAVAGSSRKNMMAPKPSKSATSDVGSLVCY